MGYDIDSGRITGPGDGVLRLILEDEAKKKQPPINSNGEKVNIGNYAYGSGADNNGKAGDTLKLSYKSVLDPFADISTTRRSLEAELRVRGYIALSSH
jgi:hypothetical protein